MANTTKDGEEPVKLPKTEDEKIVDLYVQGKNLYDITFTIYKFGGEEAMEHVRQVLHKAGFLDPTHDTPATRLMDV